MQIAKKLILAPFFLILFSLLILLLKPVLSSYELIFSLSIESLYQLLIISSLILASAFLFVLFAILAQNWIIILPVGLLSASLPLIIFTPALGLIAGVGVLVSLLLVFVSLDQTLKSSINFEPFHILGPSIRHLSTFLIITFSITYFFSINTIIQKEGFQIPDSLIQASLSLAGNPEQQIPNIPATAQIPPEQLEFLKQNPDLLKQYGLNPSILDNLNKPSQSGSQSLISQDFLKKTLKDQFDKLLKPYINFIPAVLALILFITLNAFVSFLSLFIYPLLWIIFYIFEKSGFVKFETEQRPVKKMII